MNLQISARRYETGSQNIAEANAIHKRLLNPAPQKRAVVAPVAEIAPIEPHREEPCHHVMLYYRRIHPKTAKRRLMELCLDMGTTYDEIVGPRRLRPIVRMRQELMWRIKDEFPHLSLPQIGLMFGNRDHSTVIHSLKWYKKRAGLE